MIQHKLPGLVIRVKIEAQWDGKVKKSCDEYRHNMWERSEKRGREKEDQRKDTEKTEKTQERARLGEVHEGAEAHDMNVSRTEILN